MSVIDNHNVPEGFVLISQEEYDELNEEQSFLNCLRGAGVDNWDGYSYAQDMYNDIHEDDE